MDIESKYEKEFKFIQNSSSFINTDLRYIRGGYHKCKPGHTWMFSGKESYLIHYILNGKGTLKINDTKYELGKFNAFIIPQDSSSQYTADRDNPWFYFWIDFHGNLADSFMGKTDFYKNSPIIYDDNIMFYDTLLDDMVKSDKMDKGRELYLNSLVYRFISRFTDISKKSVNENKVTIQEKYINDALRIIGGNYQYPLTINDIAASLSIDRKYLAFLSKKILNKSLKQYLVEYRMKKACELLKINDLSISDVANSTGYSDPLVFSREFKKRHLLSPTEYRKEVLE